MHPLEENLGFELPPLDSSYTSLLLKDFFLRGKVIRDAVIYQSVIYLSFAIRIFNSNYYQETQTYLPIKDGVLAIGVIGCGTMGKILFELLNDKVVHGTFGVNAGVKLSMELSTRVPEKLSAERFNGVKVYYDNKKVVANSAVVFLCVPKHKVKNVFNSIRQTYHAELKAGRVTSVVIQAKTAGFLGRQSAPTEDLPLDG